MPFEVHLDAAAVARGEHEKYSPELYDFVWNADFTECDVLRLAWPDAASYADYQGDANACYDHFNGGPDDGRIDGECYQ
jgi:hypothetical protein